MDNLVGAILRLTSPQSQRAEYLADALASEVVGGATMGRALERFAYEPLISARINGSYGAETPDGRAYLDDAVAAIEAASPEARAYLRTEAVADVQSVDRSHPSTAFRVEFL